MSFIFRKTSVLRLVFLLALSVSSANISKATHIFGADFYYSWVSGNTYTISLAVYGDCSGAAFPSLTSSMPEVEIWNNGNYQYTVFLQLTGPAVEVTPVCAGQIGNTTCNGGTVPGIKRYIYSVTVNLGSTSPNWLFRFNGEMSNNTQAGRSNIITNIAGSGTSLMVLEATLNNTLASNDAAVFTTIPTPFFCINIPAQYNSGAVDANGDSLTFSLVPGLEPSGTVVYPPPYSALQPLATAPGSFSFSNQTGQLDFTPNMIQNSLVVNKVFEYRNGVLVGTCMREMVFVVLNTCNNNAPTGVLNNPNGVVFSGGNTITVCETQGAFSFNINATDPDMNVVNVVVAGPPSGATVSTLANNTLAPIITFAWNTSGVALGTYTFYVTYTDNGCPLSSKQTVAYSIHVVPKREFTYAQITPATCVAKAKFTITTTGSQPASMTVTQGAATILNFNGFSGTHTDSLIPGTYTIRVSSGVGCYKDTIMTIAPPPLVGLSAAISHPFCSGSNNGSVTLNPSGGTSPFQFALGIGPFGSSATFGGLGPGSYAFTVRDAYHCIGSQQVVLVPVSSITVAAARRNATCSTLDDGQVTLFPDNGSAPYSFAIGSGPYGPSAVFGGLTAGSYTFHIKDALNCVKDTVITILDSLSVTAGIVVTTPLCFGQANGSFTLSGSGGGTPYTFAIGTQSYSSSSVISGLAAGSYVLHVKDANGCIKDTFATIGQPSVLVPAVLPTAPLCFEGTDGQVQVSVSGGTPAYTFAADAGPYGSSSLITGLSAGAHTIHIKDANGCLKDTVVTISQPAPIVANYLLKDPLCAGNSTGEIQVVASGGTPGYSYAANGGVFQTSFILAGMQAGAHQVIIQDANGCLLDTTLVLADPPAVFLLVNNLVNPTCLGYKDGSVVLGGTGGNPPYQYSSDNISYTSQSQFASLGAGSHQFFIRDGHGCIHDTTILLTGLPPLFIDSLDLKHVSCNGAADGQVLIYASGGVPAYSYSIDGKVAVSSPLFAGLPAADYA
ncbi:MAG: hypothetical protein EOP49_11150, partial [Sphingobacteriales bacterium]